jgi:hypothetical protein
MSNVDVVIDNETVEKEPLTPEYVWIRIDRDGARKHVEIPFWFLAHLRAMTNTYAKDTEFQKQYLEAYQEGYKENVMVDWLADRATRDREAPIALQQENPACCEKTENTQSVE